MLLIFGTVLGDGEDAASRRAVTAAGPALAAAYHAIYESKGADGVDKALLARAAPLLASWTMTGTRADIAARLRALGSSGITEVAYQPMGPDIPRELAAFARAAGLTGTGAEGA